jgi:hypothetical protein
MGYFIQHFTLLPVFLLAMFFKLFFAKFLQDSHLAVGLDKALLSALYFARNGLALLLELCLLGFQGDFATLRFDEQVDVDGSRPGSYPPLGFQGVHLRSQGLYALFDKVVDSISLGQLRTSLVASVLAEPH